MVINLLINWQQEEKDMKRSSINSYDYFQGDSGGPLFLEKSGKNLQVKF